MLDSSNSINMQMCWILPIVWICSIITFLKFYTNPAFKFDKQNTKNLIQRCFSGTYVDKYRCYSPFYMVLWIILNGLTQCQLRSLGTKSLSKSSLQEDSHWRIILKGVLLIFSWMITNWGKGKNLVWQFLLTTIVSLLEISLRIGTLMNSLRSFLNTHVSRNRARHCTVLLVNIPEAEHNISECLT